MHSHNINALLPNKLITSAQADEHINLGEVIHALDVCRYGEPDDSTPTAGKF